MKSWWKRIWGDPLWFYEPPILPSRLPKPPPSLGACGGPKYVLEIPTKLSVEALERLKEQWNQTYSGPEHSLIVLEEGAKLHKLEGDQPKKVQICSCCGAPMAGAVCAYCGSGGIT